ncbi:MAG: hypothetical protein ACXWMS_07715 [Syntrophales bacterium]
MELSTNTPPTGPTELEQLGKEQTLGEAKYLGRPRLEASSAITTAVTSGPATTSGRTEISRGSQTATIPAAIANG